MRCVCVNGELEARTWKWQTHEMEAEEKAEERQEKKT